MPALRSDFFAVCQRELREKRLELWRRELATVRCVPYCSATSDRVMGFGRVHESPAGVEAFFPSELRPEANDIDRQLDAHIRHWIDRRDQLVTTPIPPSPPHPGTLLERVTRACACTKVSEMCEAQKRLRECSAEALELQRRAEAHPHMRLRTHARTHARTSERASERAVRLWPGRNHPNARLGARRKPCDTSF